MKQLRKCDIEDFNTGVSKCQIDFSKLKGAIIVPMNTKLPANLTAEKLEELVHADPGQRVYGLITFVEYAKNGGEAQTTTNGYGPESFSGFSARKDTFTLDDFYPELHANITRNAHRKRGVYFFDEDRHLYGLNDGSDVLAPFPMSSIYSDATPHPTSSAKATMSVTFAYMNVKQAVLGFDYIKLPFDPFSITLGLTEVVLEKVTSGGNEYKLYEKTGHYDVTPIYGPLIMTAGESVVSDQVTAVTYNEDSETLSFTSAKDAEVRLKSPSALYAKDIKGIVQAA